MVLQVYRFQNIRFGKAPVGDLRFAAPQYPDAVSDNKKIVDNSYGPNCIQAKAGQNVTVEPIADNTQSEDCLFLDVYAPAWAFEDTEEELPVIVWIYGGAYIFGGKNTELQLGGKPFSAYDGKGIMEASNMNVIWVVGNYRVGAYGFLAGNTMEKHGQPNAGLHDQRLLLDWVQKYIGQLRGDKKAVSVWGLSAGGGSILHHLTAYGGKAEKHEQPLFNQAAIWSPAFQWSYDRNGALEETFMNFTRQSKCDAKSSNAIECLRKLDKDSDVLREANQKIVSQNIALGMFPFGPAVDNDLVPDLPAVLLNEGESCPVLRCHSPTRDRGRRPTIIPHKWFYQHANSRNRQTHQLQLHDPIARLGRSLPLPRQMGRLQRRLHPVPPLRLPRRETLQRPTRNRGTIPAQILRHEPAPTHAPSPARLDLRLQQTPALLRLQRQLGRLRGALRGLPVPTRRRSTACHLERPPQTQRPDRAHAPRPARGVLQDPRLRLEGHRDAVSTVLCLARCDGQP